MPSAIPIVDFNRFIPIDILKTPYEVTFIILNRHNLFKFKNIIIYYFK